MTDTPVHVLVTGQFRRAEFLAESIRDVTARHEHLAITWTVSTWLPELNDKDDLRAELATLGVRIVAGPPPPLWGRSTAVPQLLALANGLIGRPSEEWTIRTRTDALTTRGIDAFLGLAPGLTAEGRDALVVERVSINVPYFATDFQFMGLNSRLTEISILDSTLLSRSLNIHPEQYYFAPLRTPNSAMAFWRRVDAGTIFGNPQANEDWTAVRLSSPLYASALAEYYTFATSHWLVLPDPELVPVEPHELGSIDDLLFNGADPRVRFDPYNFVATAADLSLMSKESLRRRPPTGFGDMLLGFMEEPPTLDDLVRLTSDEVGRLAAVASLREYRRDVSRFTPREIDFTALPHGGEDAAAAERVRALEAENSLLRNRLSSGEADTPAGTPFSVDLVVRWDVSAPGPHERVAAGGPLVEVRLDMASPESVDGLRAAVEALMGDDSSTAFLDVMVCPDDAVVAIAQLAAERGWFVVMPVSRAVRLGLPLAAVFGEVSEYERVPEWQTLAGLAVRSVHSDWWLVDDRLTAMTVDGIAIRGASTPSLIEGWARAQAARGITIYVESPIGA